MAARIDVILKLSVVASVLLASSSVGYYYVIYLPHQDARLEPERALEGLRAAARKRAEQERLLSEQQVAEQRALEQQAAEQRQSQERADRYKTCLSQVTESYNEARIAACNRLQEKVIRDHDSCVKGGFPKKVCDLAHVVREPSPSCPLPRAIASNLDAEAEKARDRCNKENGAGLQ